MILTSKGDHLFSSFGIIPIRIGKWSKIAQEKIMIARRLIEIENNEASVNFNT
jgi:hypothetical protein